MPTIEVEETVDVARDALFAILTDHEGYGRFPGVAKSELLRAGEGERNGLGALRRVHLGGPIVLDEEIVAFDAPWASARSATCASAASLPATTICRSAFTLAT